MKPPPPPWSCLACTVRHDEEREVHFLWSKLCGAARPAQLNASSPFSDEEEAAPRTRRSKRNKKDKKDKCASGAAGSSAAPGASEAGTEVDAPAPSAKSAAASLVTLSLGVCAEERA